jgi:ligand-binding SRPBCC domain-containing protein
MPGLQIPNLMHFKISTRIATPFRQEMKGMTKERLLQLNPKFPPYEIVRFDGIYQGAEVHIVLHLAGRKEHWEYLISEVKDTEDSWSFVDESRKQPFFLRSWKHRYTICGDATYTKVTDQLEFRARFFLLDLLLYPWLYLHFLYRKPVYRKISGGQ